MESGSTLSPHCWLGVVSQQSVSVSKKAFTLVGPSLLTLFCMRAPAKSTWPETSEPLLAPAIGPLGPWPARFAELAKDMVDTYQLLILRSFLAMRY